jgi:hypothetical protein
LCITFHLFCFQQLVIQWTYVDIVNILPEFTIVNLNRRGY